MIGPTRRFLLPLILLALGACASERWLYDKPKATTARMEQDMAACRKEASSPYGFAIFHADRLDREAFNRCMERKGYTARLER